MNTYVDFYCERTGIGLFNEPLNLITNAGFLVAAWLGWYWQRRNSPPFSYKLLVGLVAAVGIGSGLFHSFASVWAMMADIIPIGMFVALTAWILVRDVLNLSYPLAKTLGAILACITIGVLIGPKAINGSGAYVGVLAMLTGFAVALRLRKVQGALIMAAVVVTFAGSLTFRGLDLAICPQFPTGTHFLWHLGNSCVVALILRFVSQYLNQQEPS